MRNDILVSIICFAYNHKEYITEAIEGCLKQIVNFRYEMIVHDDASTDGTAEIIKEYEKKYPDIVKGIYEEENQYSKSKNFVRQIQKEMISAARGNYIMWCEGDDYWIDPTKMQRQIDYLEQNTNCAMVVHSAAVWDTKNKTIRVTPQYWEDKNLSPEELINRPNGYIASAAMAYRKEDFELKEFFSEAEIGDYTAQLYCLTRGNIYYIDRIMSVYRLGHTGSWQESQINNAAVCFKHCVNMIRFLDLYDQYTEYAYRRYLVKEMQKYIDMAVDINSRKDIFQNIAEVQLRDDTDYTRHLEELFRICNQVNNPEYIDRTILNFCQNYQKILLMGAGEYAAVLARQLNNHAIEFEGFVVSPGREVKESYLGKPVYQLNRLPYEINEVGILVGIHANIWDEVERTLIAYKVHHYYCPYLFAAGGKKDDWRIRQ